MGTALLDLADAPGAPGVAGGGGLFNRQPRSTILVILTALVLVAACVVPRARPPAADPARRTRARSRSARWPSIVLAVVGRDLLAGRRGAALAEASPSSDTPPDRNPISTVPPHRDPEHGRGNGRHDGDDGYHDGRPQPTTASTPTTTAR